MYFLDMVHGWSACHMGPALLMIHIPRNCLSISIPGKRFLQIYGFRGKKLFIDLNYELTVNTLGPK